jgi:uncharacterized DUF497 family protein
LPPEALEPYFHQLLLGLGGWAQLGRYRLWQAELTGADDRTVTDLLAIRLVWEEALISEDRRKAYGEKRMIAIAPMGRRLFVVVYTDRGSYRRVISLRKANDREIKAYIAHF